MPRKNSSDAELRALLKDLARHSGTRPIKHRPLKLVRVGEGEWEFDFRDSIPEAEEMMNQGCMNFSSDNFKDVEKCFRRVLEVDTDHLDGLHHLAIVLWETDREEEAMVLWDKAIETARKAIPPRAFKRGEHTIPWLFLNNRPFLRLLEARAMNLIIDGDIDGSITVFEEIISYNPNDNQGIRATLVKLYLETKRYDDLYALCEKYRDDGLSAVLYGRPLVLIKMGRKKEAEKALKEAIKYFPKVADELLERKHVEPETETPGYITYDGWDQAYDYWENFGLNWDKDAFSLLRAIRKSEKGKGKKGKKGVRKPKKSGEKAGKRKRRK